MAGQRAPLEPQAIDAALAQLPGWQLADGRLRRILVAPTFRAAQQVVNRIADLAEGADHHPDLTWSHRRLTIELVTHDRGAVTALDLRVAALIEHVLTEHALTEHALPERVRAEHG